MNRLNRQLRNLIMPILLALLVLGATATPTLLAADAARYDYQEKVLDNGLRVVTLADNSCPIVSVQIWYHVGSKNERPERQGFAHMFEHMMFRGTDRLGPTDHFDLVRRTGGTLNGYTSFDNTVYYEILPSNQLELALWLEAERMALLKIDEEGFETERKVVEEERRMGLNRPYGTLSEELMAALFKVHPYRWTPIGKIPHLRAATVAELQAFWNRYYVPNNAMLLIVGDIEHEKAWALADKYFGWIPKSADPPKVALREPTPTEARSVILHQQNAPVPMIAIAYRTVPIMHEDTIPLNLLATIVSKGNSSRLYRELVAEKQLAVDIMPLSFSLEQEGVLGFGAMMSPRGADPDKVLEIIESHVAHVREDLVSEQELTKAKNRILKALVTQNLTINSKARALGHAGVIEGDLERVNEDIESIRRVTRQDLRRVARNYLVSERSLTFRVPPSRPGAPVGSGTADDEVATPSTTSTGDEVVEAERVTRPADFPADPPIAEVLDTLPRTESTSHELDNGLKVIVVPNHEVPYVSAQLALRAGSWTESKPGAASIAMSMLTKGSVRHTEAELAEELALYAISLGGSASSDTSSVSASTLTEHLPRALGLMAEVVRTPTFPSEEFAKLQKQVLASLAVTAVDASDIAGRELRRLIYGEHPYSRTPTGQIEDVERLTVEAARKWWEKFVRPDMAVLILAGDVDDQTALKLACEKFGDWKAEGPKPRVILPEFPTPKPTEIVLVDQPGAVQCQIRVGQLGFGRRSPNYFTSVVVSDYFGGGFDSRLNEIIRVQKGLTYGARGGYGARLFGGSFTAQTFTKPETTAEAVATILDEIQRLKKEGPGDDELKKRQAYYIGSFARNRETPQQVAGDLSLIEMYNLPDDHFQAMLRAIAKTTPERCLSLAQRTIDPAKLAVVVVGDASKVKADLEKIAPVRVIQP